MSNNVPYWILDLCPGDELVVCFPYTGTTIFAEIIENYPSNDLNLFGTITIRYNWNNVAKEEDLLYDDYDRHGVGQNN